MIPGGEPVVRLCGLFIGLIVLLPVGVFGESMGKQGINGDKLIKGVLSRDCRVRYEAVSSLMRSAGPELRPLVELVEELKRKSPQAAAYMREAIEFLKAMIAASGKTENLVRSKLAEAAKKAEVDKKGKSSELDEIKVAEYFVSSLSVEIQADRSPANQAILVGYLARQVAHNYPDYLEEAKPFLDALDRLISGRDLRLRVFAAADLASAVPQVRSKKILIPILLEGLKSEEFPVRDYAQAALRELTKQKICFDPLDPPAQRLQAIAAWQQWWKKESRKKE